MNVKRKTQISMKSLHQFITILKLFTNPDCYKWHGLVLSLFVDYICNMFRDVIENGKTMIFVAEE